MKKRLLIFILVLAVLCAPILGSCGEIDRDKAGDIFDTPQEGISWDGEAPQEEELPQEETPQGESETKAETPDGQINEGLETAAEKDIYIRSLTAGLNIRSGAGTSYASLGKMDKGDLLPYLGDEGGWFRTYYKGKKAYVSKSYCLLFTMEKSLNQDIENVLLAAKNLLGYTYVYGAVRYHNGGGKPLSGFVKTQYDCSSLTQYIYYIGAGVCLGLTTREQVLQGTYVKGENIQRGDLLFFTNSSRKSLTGVNRVGHVAVYLGNNYILHTASDFAVIEEISALRWSYFIQARRFF